MVRALGRLALQLRSLPGGTAPILSLLAARAAIDRYLPTHHTFDCHHRTSMAPTKLFPALDKPSKALGKSTTNSRRNVPDHTVGSRQPPAHKSNQRPGNPPVSDFNYLNHTVGHACSIKDN